MSTTDEQKSDISLTKIYEAITKPNSSLNTRCQQELRSASIKQINYTLRKLLSYSKYEQAKWSPRRLIRCLDFIYNHAIKFNQDELVSTASFKICVRWCLKILEQRNEVQVEETLLQIQITVKFICCLLENSTQTDSLAVNEIITTIRHHRGVESLLYWLQSSIQPIQLYSVRALTAQVQLFAKDMVKLNGYTILSNLLSDIPDLLNTLSLTPPVTDAAQRRKELDHCVMICRLLDAMIKIDCASSPTPTNTRSAYCKESFPKLATYWLSVCSCEYRFIMEKISASMNLKNLKFLVYSLTSIVQNLTSQSKEAAAFITTVPSRNQWQPLLSVSMREWVQTTCCYSDSPPPPSASLGQTKSIITKLLQISIKTLSPSQPHQLYINQMLWDLSNVLKAYISQPVLPEQAATIGLSTLIHKNLRIDVEERGFRVSSEMLEESQGLLVLVLDSFIHHVQLASPEFIQSIAGHVAWCLKSLLTILLLTETLGSSSLTSRVLKLIVFFLHYDEAIDVLAASTTNISAYIWSPTIELAKQGLVTASGLTLHTDLTPEQANTIYKAKRAFVALQKISKHPRACERLVDCDVLQLVDVSLIPDGHVIEKTSSLLSVYALFGRFVAALSRRTAFVRARLRDECGLFPMIIRLLQEAVTLREVQKQGETETQIAMGWNQLIASCLMVISAFQYDESSMQMWLSWPMEETRVSVLSNVLCVLFPWRNAADTIRDTHTISKCLQTEFEVMNLAAQVLDQLSSLPSCGRQMIVDKQAMSDLGTLLACSAGGLEETDLTEASCDSEKEDLDCVEEKAADDQQWQFTEFMDCLKRSAIRIFSSHENIQFVILSDTFTTFFQPLIAHPIHQTVSQYWISIICSELSEKKLDDYMSLFNFTEFGEYSTRLHEFTAIGLAYLANGNHQLWNRLLGLRVLEGDIVSKKDIFSILCQMLVYGLEYEAEDEEQLLVEEPDVQALLSTLTPMRRNAAAQAIEVLAMTFEPTWLEEIAENPIDVHLDHVMIDDESDIVQFTTDDANGAYISGSRQLLRSRSPIFDALLSGVYSESTLTAIPLHDVTFQGLNYFVSIIHQLNKQGDMWMPATCWNDIIELLQTADRFGSVDVMNLCEQWVLEKVVDMNQTPAERAEGLEGAVRLFRHCRDPIEKDGGITSKTWPFTRVLRECLRCIAQYMSEASKTNEFLKMVQEGNEQELNAFCNGLACLLQF